MNNLLILRVVYFLVTELEQTLKNPMISSTIILFVITHTTWNVDPDHHHFCNINHAAVCFHEEHLAAFFFNEENRSLSCLVWFYPEGRKEKKKGKNVTIQWEIGVTSLGSTNHSFIVNSCTKIITWIHGNFISCYERKGMIWVLSKSCFNIKDVSKETKNQTCFSLGWSQKSHSVLDAIKQRSLNMVLLQRKPICNGKRDAHHYIVIAFGLISVWFIYHTTY